MLTAHFWAQHTRNDLPTNCQPLIVLQMAAYRVSCFKLSLSFNCNLLSWTTLLAFSTFHFSLTPLIRLRHMALYKCVLIDWWMDGWMDWLITGPFFCRSLQVRSGTYRCCRVEPLATVGIRFLHTGCLPATNLHCQSTDEITLVFLDVFKHLLFHSAYMSIH